MGGRWYPAAVIACWLAAMSWLTVEKILPAIQGGDQPDYQAVLPEEGAAPAPVCWEIQYNKETIGWAASLSTSDGDGGGEIVSVVHFEKLPLSEIFSQVLGTMGALVRPLWSAAGDDVTVDMSVDSHMTIAAGGHLDHFVTRVRLADRETVVEMRGTAHGNKLKVEVYTPSTDFQADEPMQLRYRDELDVPADALVTGALSPQSKLAHLRLGQTWTFPVYRPFPPNAPLQLMQAKVERDSELVVWNGETQQTFLVAFRDDAGSGPTFTREPVGRLWVREDGTVLQQETRLANLHFMFVRLQDESCEHCAEELENVKP